MMTKSVGFNFFQQHATMQQMLTLPKPHVVMKKTNISMSHSVCNTDFVIQNNVKAYMHYRRWYTQCKKKKKKY